MSRFFVFDQDGVYDQGSLAEHLSYLRRHLGTPQGECFGHLSDAVEMAAHWAGEHTQVITDADFKIIETFEETR